MYLTRIRNVIVHRGLGIVLMASCFSIASSHAADNAPHPHGKTSEKHAGHSAMDKDHAGHGSMKMTGDPDHDFATMMRHHHQQGVKMAEQELRNGKDPAMRAAAQKIIDNQKKEIAEFDRWISSHSPKAQ